MATTESGSLNIIPVTTSQNNKINSFNGHETAIIKSTSGILNYDAAGLSGTQVLTEDQSRNGMIQITGALTAAMTLELDDDVEQSIWVRDRSTGYAVTMKPTGGTGPVLAKDRWVKYTATTTAFTQCLSGWQDPANAGALTFAAAYQVVAARPLLIYKEGTDVVLDGGRVTLEGCVEETTTVPAAGDTIVTLPVHYRPKHDVAFCVVAESETAANADMIMIDIDTAGAVKILNLGVWATATNASIDLSGISFFVGG